jgi:hypothetical protein
MIKKIAAIALRILVLGAVSASAQAVSRPDMSYDTLGMIHG